MSKLCVSGDVGSSQSGRYPTVDRRPSSAQFRPKDIAKLQISEQLATSNRLHNRQGRWRVRVSGGNAPPHHEKNLPQSRR